MTLSSYIKTIKEDYRINFIKKVLNMGIKITIISPKFRILKFSKGGISKLLYNEQIFLNQKPGTIFTKNKEITKILLKQKGLNVPEGIVAKNLEEALSLMKKNRISFPAVVKPLDAAKGLGVTVGIKNLNQFKKAVQKTKIFLKSTSMKCSGLFIVEKMKTGKDHRILVINNKVVACAIRIPGHITGDGKRSVEKIIKSFNDSRPEKYALKIDNEVLSVLKGSNLSPSSVLPKNKILWLRKNSNISSGGTAVDKTRVISKRFKNIAVTAEKTLGLLYAGVDIITEDISSNSPSQDYTIIEINGAPQYDIHEKPVIIGKEVDVTKVLINEFMKKI